MLFQDLEPLAMRLPLRSLVSICSLLFATEFVYAQWVPTGGPCSTKFTALLVNGHTLFGGTYNQGLYRSTDDGRSWTPADSGIPNASGAPVHALCSNGNCIFAAAANIAVRSTDNGDHWVPVNSGLPSSDPVMALMASGTKLYAALSGRNNLGVFVSADSGASWTPINNGLDSKDVQALGVAGSNLLAGTFSGRIYVSTDAGGSWTQAAYLSWSPEGGPVRAAIQAFAATDNAVIAGTCFGIFVSKDKGLSWTPGNLVDGTGAGLTNIHAFAAVGTKIFAGATEAGAEGSLYVSTDGGLNWTTGSLTNAGIFALAAEGSNLFAGTSAGALLSTDAGDRWASMNTGLTRASVRILCPVGGRLYAGDYGGLFVSSDNGSSWSRPDLRYSPGVTSFATNGSVVWAGTDGGPRLSDDNGVHWGIANYGFQVPYPGAPSPVNAIFANGLTLLASSYFGTLLRSVDGYSWTVLSARPGYLLCFALVGNTLYAGTDGEGVVVTTDNGNTWSHSALYNQRVQTLASGGGALFAGTHGSGIFRSTDGGASWTAVNAGLTQMDVRSLASGGSALFAATYGGGVFRSNDNGASWDPVNGGLPTLNVFALAFNGSTFLAGTENGGVWEANLAQLVSVPLRTQTRAPDFRLEQNYPNPFNPSTTIRYVLPHRAHVTLSVFGALGQKLADLVSEDVEAGSHNVQFGAGNLASGAYFYRLSAVSPGSRNLVPGGARDGHTESFVMTRQFCIVK